MIRVQNAVFLVNITIMKDQVTAVTSSELKTCLALFDHTSDGMLLLQNGCFINGNHAAAQMLGYRKPADLLSLSPANISPALQPDGITSEDKAGQMLQIALESGHHRFEWLHFKMDKTPIWIEVSLTSIVTADNQLVHVIWRDINARKEAEIDFLHTKKQMEEIINSLPVAIVRAEVDSINVGYFNECFQHLFGWTLQDINTMEKWFINAYPDPNYRESIIAEWEALIDETHDLGLATSPHPIIAQVTCKDGSVKVCKAWYYQNLGNVFGIFHDITTESEAENQLLDQNSELERLSRIDGLTGLLNRMATESYLRDEIYRSQRYDSSPLSVIMFDLDDFKLINDNYGHPQGDMVLRMVAEQITSCIRHSDKAGRWGGEEFLILCPNTDFAGAMAKAEKLHQTISEQTVGKIGEVTASFGVVELQKKETIENLLHRVDLLLYEAKDRGRNCIVG